MSSLDVTTNAINKDTNDNDDGRVTGNVQFAFATSSSVLHVSEVGDARSPALMIEHLDLKALFFS
jgi:hypothetical protein